jgi:hypothetical protein
MSSVAIFARRALAAALSLALAATFAPQAAADQTERPPPAQSSDNAQQNTTAQDKPAPGSPDEVVCRKEEAGTGSRLGRRKVCMTRREWDEIARDSQTALRQSQDKGLKSNPTSGKTN